MKSTDQVFYTVRIIKEEVYKYCLPLYFAEEQRLLFEMCKEALIASGIGEAPYHCNQYGITPARIEQVIV